MLFALAQPQAPPASQGKPRTCVAHEVTERRVQESVETTGVIARPRISTQLVLRGRVGVTAEVSSLEGGLCFHAGIAAGEDL